jgi:hypothetical protein
LISWEPNEVLLFYLPFACKKKKEKEKEEA